MQPKPFPESQNHGDWRESKSRRPFFRSLLGCTIWCLRSLAWEGKLKPLTLGKRLLFPRELLDAFIEQQKSAVN